MKWLKQQCKKFYERKRDKQNSDIDKTLHRKKVECDKKVLQMIESRMIKEYLKFQNTEVYSDDRIKICVKDILKNS